MLRRLTLAAASLAAVAGCQNYRFKQVSAQPVQVVNQQVKVGAKQKPPDVMIVQDTSGSMCESIQLTDGPNGGGNACLGSPAGGQAYCSFCQPGNGNIPNQADCDFTTPTANPPCATKMQLTSNAINYILSQLKPPAGELFMGLAAFPADNQCATGSVQVPVGDATTTIPKIQNFYTGIANNPQGGTPTAATLLAAVAADPTMSNPDPTARKIVLLVTDGLPNCNPAEACSGMPWSDGIDHGCESTTILSKSGINAAPPAGCVCSFGDCADTSNTSTCCTTNSALYCLDDTGSVAAVTSLYNNQNIVTYVVGMGLDYTNATVLDAMAAAGHGSPTHYQADDPASLLAVLQSLLQQIVTSCDYTLDATPVSPGLISVTLNTTPLVAGDPNGYTFNPPNGISINGTSCTALTSQGGTAENLEITAIAN